MLLVGASHQPGQPAPLGLDTRRVPAGVPVMVTFVIDDGAKITRWTDYFDVSLLVKLLQGEDISAVVPAR